VYLLLRIEDGDIEDGAALAGKLNWPAHGASLLRDMIRFVPELAPLVPAAIASQPPNEQP
jgi:hypothetical protein